MRFLIALLVFLVAGCGTVAVRESGLTPQPGTITTVQVTRGATGALPGDVAATIDRAIQSRLDHHGLPAGSGARATWRVIQCEEGSRAGSAISLGISGSASVTLRVRLTTASGQLIQEFETAGSDNSMGPRYNNAGAFAGRAAGDQIARVLGR